MCFHISCDKNNEGTNNADVMLHENHLSSYKKKLWNTLKLFTVLHHLYSISTMCEKKAFNSHID